MPEPKELLVDIGDISLAVLHWPPRDTAHSNNDDPVLLLHATGFHARCWHEVVKHLPGHNVYAADLRFHGNSGALGPVDWGVMAQDIVKLVQALDLNSVLGVGHSIGGHLLARVAAQHSALFKHLVLVDPVITSPERYALFREHSAALKIEDHPVARRKNAWENAQQMQDRFREREPFNSWQPAVLEDYCNYALKPAGADGLHQLACDPLNEAAVYINQTGNEVILDLLTDINVPVTLLRAPPGDSDVPNFSHSPTWPEIARLLPDCTEVFLPDHNHFIPMQDPQLVARHIKAVS
ncbi:MAG: alpha/beta fold hydrolase [Halioglobus sp.]